MSAESSPVETCSPSSSSLSCPGAPHRLHFGRRPNQLHNLAERPRYSSSSSHTMAGSIALLTPQSLHSSSPFLHPETQSEAQIAPSLALPAVAAAASATATLAAAKGPSQPQRPKLSLNTAATPNPRSFGRGNTGLRLDTVSNVASPTVRNTFRNTYDNGLGAYSHTGTGTPITSSRAASSTSASAVPSLSPSSVSSSSSSPEETSSSLRVPYSIPCNLHPILRNSPIQKTRQIMTSTPTSSTPRTRLFHPTRRVTFAPAHALCQEISTSIYLARHQDLLEAEDEHDREQEAGGTSSSSITSARRSEKSPRSKEVHIDPRLLAPEKASNETARVGDKRESSSPESPSETSSGSSGDEDENTCPKTPVAGRAKRRREWVWTLGPVGGASVEP